MKKGRSAIKRTRKRKRHIDNKIDSMKDVKMQREIRARAYYSLALLGMGCFLRGGRFIDLRPDK